MKAQRDLKKGLSLHAFCKKVNKGYRKYYGLLHDSYRLDRYTSCVASQEATDMNILHTIPRLLFAVDGHIYKMS